MKERSILFKAPMVRAILENRKTQTRRIIKPSHRVDTAHRPGETHIFSWNIFSDDPQSVGIVCKCPYGVPGDRLWVRETWKPDIDHEVSCITYAADNFKRYLKSAEEVELWFDARKPCEHYPQMLPAKWRPSIFMPRWVSRIALEITGVRVERLNAISAGDAYSEGAADWAAEVVRYGNKFSSVVGAFESLWKSINGVDSWNENPWVWIIEFKRVTA